MDFSKVKKVIISRTIPWKTEFYPNSENEYDEIIRTETKLREIINPNIPILKLYFPPNTGEKDGHVETINFSKEKHLRIEALLDKYGRCIEKASQ